MKANALDISVKVQRGYVVTKHVGGRRRQYGVVLDCADSVGHEVTCTQVLCVTEVVEYPDIHNAKTLKRSVPRLGIKLCDSVPIRCFQIVYVKRGECLGLRGVSKSPP